VPIHHSMNFVGIYQTYIMEALKEKLLTEEILSQEMSKKELLMDEIIKQGELGFSKAEIIENLKTKGLSHDEIKEMKDIIAQSESKPQKSKQNRVSLFLAIFVALLIGGRAFQAFYHGHWGWGIFFLLLGASSVVSILLTRKK
jgi:hypothetical protein